MVLSPFLLVPHHLRILLNNLPSIYYRNKRTTLTLTKYFALSALYTALALDYTTTHHIDFHPITGASMSPTLRGTESLSTQSWWYRLVPLSIFSERGVGKEGRADQRDRVLFWKRLRFPRAVVAADAEGGGKEKGQTRWTPKRGSIVSFASPTGLAEPAVKRVVAIEGDVVTPVLRRRKRVDTLGSVYDVEGVGREGKRTLGDVYDAGGVTRIDPGPAGAKGQQTIVEDTRTLEPVVVPFGHVWVEGDNTEHTVDSNEYGPVSKSLIDGVAFGIWRKLFKVERPDWVGDGWEERMKGRLVKRREELWSGIGEEGIPEEWRMYE